MLTQVLRSPFLIYAPVTCKSHINLKLTYNQQFPLIAMDQKRKVLLKLKVLFGR